LPGSRFRSYVDLQPRIQVPRCLPLKRRQHMAVCMQHDRHAGMAQRFDTTWDQRRGSARSSRQRDTDRENALAQSPPSPDAVEGPACKHSLEEFPEVFSAKHLLAGLFNHDLARAHDAKALGYLHGQRDVLFDQQD